MPPKQRINREMILESAFAMFINEGMEVVNARSVAKALGCSTQPIFSYYTGMQDLRDALDAKARELFASEVLSAERGEGWMVNTSEAFVRFACNRPHIYRHLFDTACKNNELQNQLCPLREEIVAQIGQQEGVSKEQAQAIYDAMFVYTVGMASVSLVGLYDLSDLRAKLEKAYENIVKTTK